MLDEAIYTLDWKDKKILRELDKNARQSSAEIAKNTGQKPEQKKLKKLELMKKGYFVQASKNIEKSKITSQF